MLFKDSIMINAESLYALSIYYIWPVRNLLLMAPAATIMGMVAIDTKAVRHSKIKAITMAAMRVERHCRTR